MQTSQPKDQSKSKQDPFVSRFQIFVSSQIVLKMVVFGKKVSMMQIESVIQYLVTTTDP